MAGFVHAYLNGEPLRGCGTFASCVSSLMIEQVGPDFTLDEKTVRERQRPLLDNIEFTVQLTTT